MICCLNKQSSKTNTTNRRSPSPPRSTNCSNETNSTDGLVRTRFDLNRRRILIKFLKEFHSSCSERLFTSHLDGFTLAKKTAGFSPILDQSFRDISVRQHKNARHDYQAIDFMDDHSCIEEEMKNYQHTCVSRQNETFSLSHKMFFLYQKQSVW